MNLFTNENLFIIAFIIILVLGIQYIVYLQLQKFTIKEINKRLFNQKKNNVQHMVEKDMKKEDNIDHRYDENTDDVDTPSDMDSNIDSYINPLPSVNNNDD